MTSLILAGSPHGTAEDSELLGHPHHPHQLRFGGGARRNGKPNGLSAQRSHPAGNDSPPAIVASASNTMGSIDSPRNRTDPSAKATLTPPRCVPPNWRSRPMYGRRPGSRPRTVAG